MKFKRICILCSIIMMGFSLIACGTETNEESEIKEKQDKEEKTSEQKSEENQSDEVLVTWNNDIDEYPHDEDTVIKFELPDGSNKEFDLEFPISITGMEMLDIDNDSEDEYVINGYFTNTLGENNMYYAYEVSDNDVEQVFPFEELSNYRGDTIFNCELVDVNVPKGFEEENIVKGIRVNTVNVVPDAGPVGYESFIGTAYCQDNKWHMTNLEYKTYGESIEEFKEENLVIPKGCEIEHEEWIDDEHTVYRVAIQNTNPDDGEYAHCMDYIYAKALDGAVTCLVVDYPSKSALYADRYINDVCEFDVVYQDVTFDGNKDILISLGRAGNQGAAIYCAYVYNENTGRYIYTPSFEDIPNYELNESEKCIYGYSRDSSVQNSKITYEYQDDEFVLVDTEVETME